MMKRLGVVAFQTFEYRNPERIHIVGSGEAYDRRSPFGGKFWRPRKFRGFEWGKVEVIYRDSPNREKSISSWLA
jgi:hypothetical protein